MRSLLGAVLSLLFRVKVIGRERLRFSGPTIIMPNHVSFLDAIFLYVYLPRNVCFVVNTTIAGRIRFVLRWVNHITIDPLNPYSLKKIVRTVQKGQPIVLFPEGRITTTGSLMKVYSGIGFVVLKTGAAVQPVVFRGLERSKLSRLGKQVNLRYFPAVTMLIDAPVHLQVDREQRFSMQKKVISDRILELLQQTLFAARQHEDNCDNLFNKLIRAGKRYGMGKVAAEDIGGRMSYRQLLIGSYALAAKFKRLLASNSTVGVLLPNSLGHLTTLFALAFSGKTAAVLNFSAGGENNVDCADTAGINVILTSRLFIEKGNLKQLEYQLAERFTLVYLEDVKERIGLFDKLQALLCFALSKQASASGRIVLFTSGSESKPKGVVLSHANILTNINQISSVIDYTTQDKMLNVLPMFHSFGLTAGTLLPVLNGVEVFLYPTPLHYKIIPEIAYDRNVTLLLGTPTFLHGYARYAHHYDFYSLRYVLAGGEKLRDEVRKLWQEKFGLRIFEGYGTTETAPVLSLNTPLAAKAGTVGKFLPGVSWRVQPVDGIDEGGNLEVSGPNVMQGYLLYGLGFVPADHWYDCGDVVSIDSQGFVTICARLKRFAKISGEMVSLDAVEKAAEQCFGSDRNAAVNLPDARKGEKIVLYTMHQPASKQLLREYMSQTRQSMLSMPAEVIVVEKLPLLGSGKTDYVALKSWQGGKEERDA